MNAAHPLLQRLKDYKFDKNYVPPTTPGSESQYKNRKELDNLRLYERNVQQLCAAMQEVVEIPIYDTVIVPREYLREKLIEVLRRFVKKTLVVDEQNHVIQRPSIMVSLQETTHVPMTTMTHSCATGGQVAAFHTHRAVA